jgi:hypothetical protein
MYHGDDEPTEVLHIYVVREAVTPPLLPIVLSVLALSVFVTFAALSPNWQPVTRAVLRVPAVPLTIRTFTAQTPIIPTGVKTYPATYAQGWLTFSNGSVIGQSIPAGFTVLASNGVPVITNTAIYVPPATANSFGIVTVSARLGRDSVNLEAYSVNLVIDSSLFVRNLSLFTGGRPAYSVKFVTSNDRKVAFSKVRDMLISKIAGLHYPCKEGYTSDNQKITSTWRCQFVTYTVPSYMHVTAVRLSGKNLIIDVWFIPRPVRIWVK